MREEKERGLEVFLLLVVLFLSAFILMGTLTQRGNLSTGGCTYAVTTAVDDYEDYFIGGMHVSIMFEPDMDGSDEAAQVSLYSCMEPDNDEACEEYYFDSDQDGVDDTNILTGSSWPLRQRGLEDVVISGWLRVLTTTAPGAGDEAVWRVCGVSQSGS